MLFDFQETDKYKIYKILGIKIKCRKISKNNLFVVSKSGKKRRVFFINGLKINFAGSGSTVILHSPLLKYKNSEIFLRDNCQIEIGASSKKVNKLKIYMYGQNQSLKIGDEFSCTDDCRILFSKEENLKVVIGKDCMFASNVLVRPSDGHTIYDKNTCEVLNKGKNIIIKDNVWIAMNSAVLKGVTIEEGCVIGTGSLVTKSCDEPNSIYAGVPARKIKSNIGWDRETIPDYLKNRK